MLVGAQKLYEWGQLTYSSLFFLEPAWTKAPFGPQVAPSLFVIIVHLNFGPDFAI